MEQRKQRIGLILVHGIGDQDRFEHLENVARHLIKAASHRHSPQLVSVTSDPGYRSSARTTIHIKDEAAGNETELHLHEVWWRDLGDQKTFGRLFKFWIWAMSIAGTRGHFAEETSEFAQPDNKSAKLKRVGLTNRLKLFFTTTFFFVMLAPLWLIVNLIKIIPGLPKIRLLDSVFNYMSSVKLYQDLSDNLRGTLSDFDQPRRISIQRRVYQEILRVRGQNYDRWYIAGHSLGSVIAFKALFAGDHAVARLLTRDAWERQIPADARKKCPAPAPHPDEPKVPIWLTPDDAIEFRSLMSGCKGFVTWGSPLEIFAHTWPATLPIARDPNFDDDFEWVNIYDPADSVASRLTSFDNMPAETTVRPVNIAVRSHALIAFSHTNYLHTEHISDANERVAFSLIDWMLGLDRNFHECCRANKLKLLGSTEIARRNLGKVLQYGIALVFGLLLWPKAMAVLLGLVRRLPQGIISLIDPDAARAYEDWSSFLTAWLDDPHTGINLVLDSTALLYTAGALLVFALLHYLFTSPREDVPHPHHTTSAAGEQVDRAGAGET